MATYSKVKGLSVITMAEGTKVGSVDELLVDPEAKAVRWMRMHTGGLFGERSWVPMDAVHGLTEDVVTVTGVDALQKPSETALVEGGRPVVGTPVVTEAGQHLGQVRDYEFAPDTFALMSLAVPQGKLFSERTLTIPANQVVTIGKDVVVVANAVAAPTAPIEPGQP